MSSTNTFTVLQCQSPQHLLCHHLDYKCRVYHWIMHHISYQKIYIRSLSCNNLPSFHVGLYQWAGFPLVVASWLWLIRQKKMKCHKRWKFGGTLVWRIEEIRQLAIFILFSIGCTVNLPIFLLPTCFERQFAKLSSFTVVRLLSLVLNAISSKLE